MFPAQLRCGVSTILLLLLAAVAQSGPAVSLHHGNGTLRISNSHYRVELNTADGIGWQGLTNLTIPPGGNRSFLQPDAPARIFEVAVHLSGTEAPIRVDSRDFRVRDVTLAPETGRCELTLVAAGDVPLELGLSIDVDDSCQTVWNWTLSSTVDCSIDFTFPILENLRLGDEIRDVSYFFPRDPGLINHIPARLLTNYGQYATSQLVDIFNDRWGARGGGIYYIWKDASLHRKSFELVKADPVGADPVVLEDRYGFPFWDRLEVESGVGVASCLPNIQINTGQPVQLAPVAIGIHSGNWRQAIADYRAWADTWYRPRRHPELAGYFTFAGYHAHDCPFWALDNAQAAIDGIPELVDQLHFIAQKVDRYGVYDPYREDWGLDGLKQFVAAAHDRGKLCSHYFQGYLAHAESDVFKQHGDEWGMKNSDGSNATAFANNCMCVAAQGWHDWMADTTSRIVRDLGLDIVYLDCLGWTTGDKFICHNSMHPHPPEYHRLSTVRDLLHTVRQAITREKPDVALTTEGPAVDLFFNDLDGNEGYGLMFSQHEAYGPPIHFMRFIYPEFKYLDLRTDSDELVKQVLFNATATAADPSVLPAAAMAHRVFHENRDAFVGGVAAPHLPTREPGLYCNRFKAAHKVAYTVWNDNDYRVAGALVPVDLHPGERIVDVIDHREARTRRIGGREHLVVDLPGKDVGVFAVVPGRIQAQVTGMFLRALVSEAPDGAQLFACLLDESDAQIEAMPVRDQDIDLVELTRAGRLRAILRLLNDGVLVDELELPELSEIDIAQGASVAAVGTGKEHGAQPESVVGQAGQWRFAWDDEPRPGWIELAWHVPQTFNRVDMEFERAEYSSRDCELLASDDGANWRSITRGSSDEVSGHVLDSVTARFLRIVFHQGGQWANLVSMTRLRAGYQGR